MITLRMGSTQAAAVDVYCLDPAHCGAFPGTVAGPALTLPDPSAAYRWILDASNTLDDEACDLARCPEDRALARSWRDALGGLAARILRANP